MYTIMVAQVLGIFFALVGISMVLNSRGTAAAIEEAVQHKGILWTWGLLSTLIGSVIVVFNSNMWTSGLPLLVTILGWIALIKGVFILLFPHAAASLYRKINKNGTLVFCGIVAIIIAAILFYW
jgi:hypothetical protein